MKMKNLKDFHSGIKDIKKLQIKTFNYENEKVYGKSDFTGVFLDGKFVDKNFTPEIIKAIQDLDLKIENSKTPFEVNYNLISAPQKNLQIGGFMLTDPFYPDIQGPLHISATGFEPLYGDQQQMANLQPLLKKNLKKIKPVLWNGKPAFVAQNVEKVCPEAVYIYKGVKCVNTDVLLAYIFAAL